MTDSNTYSSFLVLVDIANYVTFFDCALFERFFIFSGPRGTQQKNFEIKTQCSQNMDPTGER
jgi:hypothetical protein